MSTSDCPVVISGSGLFSAPPAAEAPAPPREGCVQALGRHGRDSPPVRTVAARTRRAALDVGLLRAAGTGGAPAPLVVHRKLGWHNLTDGIVLAAVVALNLNKQPPQLQGITLRLSWRSCRYSLYYNVLITWSIKTETLELLGLVSYSVGK